MKKKLIILLTTLLAVMCLFAIMACDTDTTLCPDCGKEPCICEEAELCPDCGKAPCICEPAPTTYNLDIDYMSSLMANIDDATALGIKKASAVNQQAAPINAAFTATANEANEVDKLWLYKTTAQSTALMPVTFSEVDTEGNPIEEVTEEEIPAQINKMYVTSGFTFIQFIPLVTESGEYEYEDESGEIQTATIEVRPTSLTHYPDGSTNFDKTDYFSDELHQSFVIDNESGNTYKIENIYISKIQNGLVEDNDGLVYDMRLSETDELEFYTFYDNNLIQVQEYFKDKYNNKYIRYSTADIVPEVENTIFYAASTGRYILSYEGIAIKVPSNVFSETETVEIRAIRENLEEYIPTETLNFPYGGYFYSYIFDEIYQIDKSGLYQIEKVEDGFLYWAGDSQGKNNLFGRINIEIGENEQLTLACNSQNGYVNSYKLYRGTIVIIETNLHPDYLGETKLFWAEAWEENAPRIKVESGVATIENSEALNILELDSEAIPENITWDYQGIKFKVTEQQSIIYYIIALDENGIPQIIKESEYVAKDPDVISLQPMNKKVIIPAA